MNFLQNITAVDLLISAINVSTYYMPTTVLGVVENSELKRTECQPLKPADQEKEIGNNFLKGKLS